MAPMTPPPETETPILDFIPGDLEPIDTPPSKKRFPQIQLPVALTQSWVKHAFRPIFFTALGVHGLFLFTPLTSSEQVKPKETAEPVKIKRLTDKVLVKSMPKVKVTTTASKPSLPKVAVASTNPIVVKAPEPEKPKPEEKKPDEKKPDEKKPDEKKPESTDNKSSASSDKGEDPSKVDPKNATTNEKDASKLDAESQKFAGVIAGLRDSLNPGEAEAEADSDLLDDPTPFFNIKPPPQGNTLISNQDVEDVESSLKTQFPDKFDKKGEYGGGFLYEAKVGSTVRYVSLVKANFGKNVMVFLWEKSPM